jgi:glycosyltransferase involved in cell wall biosynthesis
MIKPEVVVVIPSPLHFNPRAQKIVNTLSKKYDILVLEWNRERHNSNENIKVFVQLKSLRLSAPYGSPFLIFYWPVFWLWVVINLIITRPKAIHACNFDVAVACYFYKIFTNTKLVFDSFDKFSLAFVPPKNKLLFKIMDTFENVIAYKSDALVTVNADRLFTYGRFLPKFVTIIMNVPQDMLKFIKKSSTLRIRNKDKFVIVYTGGIAHDRGLLLLKEVIKDIDKVKLILAGRVVDNTLNKLLPDSKIRYFGMLSYDDAIELERQADLIPVLYDPTLPINRVANPNKLFEAMMLGVPVITNVCKEIVREAGCGLIVEYNLKSVKEALDYLISHPEVREKMSANGRKAFEEKYNWNLMERRLLRLYQRLLDN